MGTTGKKLTLNQKLEIIRAFITKLEEEALLLSASAKAAHEAATHEESQSEDPHDTRGLEASYLAGAQAARVKEIKDIAQHFKTLLDESKAPKDSVSIGAIVRLQPLKSEDGPHLGSPIQNLVALAGGGTAVTHPEVGAVQILSPHSPLGQEIIGLKKGDLVSIESKAGTRYYEILQVC